MTLWELTDSAELVVLARVEEIEPPSTAPAWLIDAASAAADWLEEAGVERPADWLPTTLGSGRLGAPSLAHLRVEAVWKGEAGSRLVVAFEPGLICPAPARYLPGERLVAFLRRDQEAPEALWTVGLSYGTLYPAQ